MILHKAARVLMREGRLPLARWAARRRLGPLPEPESNTVAILRPDRIGDFVLASRALAGLRQAFPDAHVTLFGHPSWLPLAEWLQRWNLVEGAGPFADDFVRLVQEDLVRPDALADAALCLARYETIVYFVASRTNAIDTLLSLVPGRKFAWQGGEGNMMPRRERANRHIYDMLHDTPQDVPEYQRNVRMVRMVDKNLDLQEAPPRWQIPSEAVEQTLGSLRAALEGPYIAVSPFTSVPLKDWPLGNYLELLRRLKEAFPECRLVLLGSETNPQLAALAKRSRGVTDLCGKIDLPQAACIIAGAELSISGDTAAAHIASAAGTSALVVMGGGHYGRFFPYPAAHEHRENVALTHEMPCFHCNWVCRYRWIREMPAPCVANVSVDRVFDAAARLLQSKGR